MADLSLGSRLFYQALRRTLAAFFRVWLRLEVHGAENIPETGGFVLAPGAHRSILDTPVVGISSGRMLRYMGADKYFAVPVFGWFLTAVGGFPVEREFTDRAALRLAQSLLEDGHPLVVFPEATRFEGPLVQPLKEGAAFLACRAGTPLVPIGIGGAQRALPIGGRFLRPTKVVLVVGEPIWPPAVEAGGRAKRSQVHAMSNELHQTLQALFDEAQIKAGA
ncbi:MAG: 1-acyl-sn-glycerol-3-phosphate acyltransferase [Acidimicrobiales bacterium]|jgi:1-acyl-sn-glycerol-3-phosphate acyltransferase